VPSPTSATLERVKVVVHEHQNWANLAVLSPSHLRVLLIGAQLNEPITALCDPRDRTGTDGKSVHLKEIQDRPP
jgi:hypothetical protein